MFIPFNYIVTHALYRGMSPSEALSLVAIMNGVRYVPLKHQPPSAALIDISLLALLVASCPPTRPTNSDAST